MSVGFRKNVLSLRAKLIIVGALVSVTIVAMAVGLWFRSNWAPSRTDYPVQGISVSSAHSEILWPSLAKQGVDFVYIRATSGKGKRDPAFARNWASARDAGLRYGAELAYDPCALASDQATMFVTTVPREAASLPPVVRLEMGARCSDGTQPGRDRILSELNTLINLIEAHSGKAALIRVSHEFDEEYGISAGINRTLWLERNYFPPDYATRPWVMWTANDARRIEGINGAVEWNIVAP